MPTYDRILVVLDVHETIPDNPESLPIEVQKAIRLVSNKQSTQIFLISCAYEKYIHSGNESLGDALSVMREAHQNQLEERLNLVTGKLKHQGYQVASELDWAYPRYERIVHKANGIDADLVIQHTRSYSKVGRMFLSNDSWQLVRTCPKPLLLVKDVDWQQNPMLMAAVDPVHSHHKPLRLDHAILDAALTTKNTLGGDLHVLHAFNLTSSPFTAADKLLQVHQQTLDTLLADYKFATDHVHLVDEPPVLALQQYEEKLKTDIIVMGALSRSRLSDALIGNTAEKVLDYLKSDVLIIKPSVTG